MFSPAYFLRQGPSVNLEIAHWTRLSWLANPRDHFLFVLSAPLWRATYMGAGIYTGPQAYTVIVKHFPTRTASLTPYSLFSKKALCVVPSFPSLATVWFPWAFPIPVHTVLENQIPPCKGGDCNSTEAPPEDHHVPSDMGLHSLPLPPPDPVKKTSAMSLFTSFSLTNTFHWCCICYFCVTMTRYWAETTHEKKIYLGSWF